MALVLAALSAALGCGPPEPEPPACLGTFEVATSSSLTEPLSVIAPIAELRVGGSVLCLGGGPGCDACAIDFAEVPLGGSRTVVLKLAVTGGVPLQVNGVTVTSTTCADFALGADPPLTVDVAASADLPLLFTPTAVVDCAAQLVIESDAGNFERGVTVVELRGTGAPRAGE